MALAVCSTGQVPGFCDEQAKVFLKQPWDTKTSCHSLRLWVWSKERIANIKRKINLDLGQIENVYAHPMALVDLEVHGFDSCIEIHNEKLINCCQSSL